MFSANTGYTAKKNFSSFRRETTEFSRIFVIDFFDMIYAEAANFSSRSSKVIIFGLLAAVVIVLLLFSIKKIGIYFVTLDS